MIEIRCSQSENILCSRRMWKKHDRSRCSERSRQITYSAGLGDGAGEGSNWGALHIVGLAKSGTEGGTEYKQKQQGHPFFSIGMYVTGLGTIVKLCCVYSTILYCCLLALYSPHIPPQLVSPISTRMYVSITQAVVSPQQQRLI